MGWQDLKVGGGGFVRGLDIAPDGTMVGRTDTNGAYLWNGTAWVQLVTASSMPAAFDRPTSGRPRRLRNPNCRQQYKHHVHDFDGYIFKSTNKGTTWTQTAFAQQYGGQLQRQLRPGRPEDGHRSEQPQHRLCRDRNSRHVRHDQRRLQTWRSVAQYPWARNAGITGILFDPAIGGVVNGVTQTIFASSYGNGVYESTNGGSTWTALTGGPTDVEYAAVSSTGVYYAVGDGNSSLWSYASGTWTELSRSIRSRSSRSRSIPPIRTRSSPITAQRRA